VGAGVGGLACAARLAAAGHAVTVVEQATAPGGKCGRMELAAGGRRFRFDSGPSLLTMPAVLEDLLRDVGAGPLELLPVEPVTRYRFADGSAVELSADRARSAAALEAWSPGAGEDWLRFLALCDRMWRGAERFLTGPPPFPPRRDARADPRDALAVLPWLTLDGLARRTARDPRLRTIVRRFATYAGADPRRCPAALAVAGYVEHAFGAWHVRGGLYRIVEALAARLEELGGELRLGTRAVGVERAGGRATGVRTDAGVVAADVVVWNGDALALDRLLGRAAWPGVAAGGPGAAGGPPARRAARPARRRSSSGLALMLALRGREPGRVHHEIRFPADYDAELDDLFAARRPVRDPTLYVAAPRVTDPDDAPAGDEAWFVLVNAPPVVAADWRAEGERVVERLGVADRLLAWEPRTPADLERETGALGGAIYGAAPRGRLGSLRRPGHRVRGIRGLYRVGGTAHPGGGLPLVMLGARLVAGEIGPA
jgi:phytoene desaturase